MREKTAGWFPVDTVSMAGLALATSSRRELTDAMEHDCMASRGNVARRPRLVFDANGHALSLRETDRSYAKALAAADIVHADGGFLVTLSRLRARKIAERSGTTDMLHDFARRSVQTGLTHYLLGGTAEVNRRCVERLHSIYPRLNIVGARDGYFTEEEEAAVVADIREKNPDVLWVGLGKPKEQVFCAKWVDEISAGWVVTCGGCFQYVTGHYSRAPRWMQHANLEWVYRAATNPRHLLLRYLITSPHALWLALTR